MKISLSTSILFAFCSVGWLNYISGLEHELGLAETWRRKSGKKQLTDAEKKTESWEPESVEKLLLRDPGEKKKSKFFSKKTEIPNCYTKKLVSLAKSSIKHELFSRYRISIPKTKGTYEEHSVGFSFFQNAPKRVQMIKCSCKLMTSAKVEVETLENHSSLDSGDSSDPYTPSNVETEGEMPQNTGSPPYRSIHEYENEVHSPVQHGVLHTQTSEHGHYEANQAFAQHKRQMFSHGQAGGSLVTQNHNNEANAQTEIQRPDHDSSSAEDKDVIPTPKSPEATKGGWGQRLKKLWPWGGTKTIKETQDGAIDQHKEVTVQTKIGSSQKNLQGLQEHQFTKKTEEERMELSHHKEAIEKEKSTSHDRSSASISSYRESFAQIEHTQTEELKQIESQHFLAERENLSARANDRSSLEEAGKFKMMASGSATQKEGAEYLSSEKEVSSEDKDLIPTPILPKATSGGWGQSLKNLWSWGGTKTIEENQGGAIDQHKEVTVQTKIGSSQETGQGLLEHQFAKRTEEERMELSHHKEAIEKEKSTSHDRSSASISSYRESSAQIEHTQTEELKQIESQHFLAERENLSARAKDSSSLEEAEKFKMVASGRATQKEGAEYLSNKKEVSNEKVTEKMVVDASKKKNEQNTTRNAQNASPGIIGGLMGRAGGLFRYYTTPTQKPESSSSEADGMEGKLIIVPARISGYDGETNHAGNVLEKRADVFQEESTESFHTMAHVGKVSITAHQSCGTVKEYLDQEKQEKSSSEGDRSARDVKVVRMLSTNSSPHHLDGNYEEHVNRTNFYSLSQEDKEYKLSKDQVASYKEAYQLENHDEKELTAEPNKDLTILSPLGKEVHESDATNTRILQQSHSGNLHAELEETKRKKDVSIPTSSSSSSSSSSQSDDKEGSKEKLNTYKGSLEELHRGESVDGKLNSKRIKTYEGEILGEKNENIFLINIDLKESKSDKSSQQEAETRDHHFEIETNAQVQGIPFEQSIKVENSKSSEEKTTHQVILEETVVEKTTNHHLFSEQGNESEESSKSDISAKSKKHMFGKSDEMMKINGELYKRVGSAREKQLHLPSSYVPHEEHHVKKVQGEVNESAQGEIAGKDSSSSSKSSKQDQDKSDQSAHEKLFRRSPVMPQRYRYAYEVPADSICVPENGEQVLYLSKGYIDGKSFFVYRKTEAGEFYPIAYIVLK